MFGRLLLDLIRFQIVRVLCRFRQPYVCTVFASPSRLPMMWNWNYFVFSRSGIRAERSTRCTISSAAWMVNRCGACPSRGEMSAADACAMCVVFSDAPASSAVTRFSSSITRSCSCTGSALVKSTPVCAVLETDCPALGGQEHRPYFSARNCFSPFWIKQRAQRYRACVNSRA